MTVNMKNAALFVFIALLGFAGYAQGSDDTPVNIPDGLFKGYLKTLTHAGGGGLVFGDDDALTVAEAAAYTGPIDVSGLGDGGNPLQDLTGLEAFVAITSFSCSGTGLSGLDLRTNVGLTGIDCSNSDLKWLKLGDIYSTLTIIDVSGNADLDCIQVSDAVAAQLRMTNNELVLTKDQGTTGFCAMDDTPPTYEFVVSETDVSAVTTVYGNDNPITIYVKFSEALLSGSFELADVNLNGGNGPLAGLGSVSAVSNLYEFTYDPGDASTSVSISVGAVTDVYGNTNSVGTPALTVIRDIEAPTVVVDDPIWTNGVATLNINIDDDNFDFSAFDLARVISVQSAPDGSIILQTVRDPTNSKHYTVTLTITDKSADITSILVKSAPIVDLAGNTSPPFSKGIPDYTAPVPLTVEIATGTKPNGDAITEATNGQIAFKFTFSEEIGAGTFTKDDITCVNCGESLTTVSPDANNVPNVYIVTVTPNQDGDVTITLTAGSVSANADANKLNQEKVSTAIKYDATRPTVSIGLQSGLSDAYTKVAAIPIRITFTETGSGSIQGFDETDITDLNGNALAVSGLLKTASLVYTATVTAASEGMIGIKVLAGVVNDAAGNMNTESNPLSITYDVTRPTYTFVESAQSDVVVSTLYGQGDAVTVYVKFSEPLRAGSFALLDVNNVDGTISGFGKIPNSNLHTFTFLRGSEGSSDFSLSADAVTDPAGNGNPSSGPILTITKDETPPSVVVTSTTDGVSSGTDTNFPSIILKLAITDPNLKSLSAFDFEGLLSIGSGISIDNVQKEANEEAYLVTLNVGTNAAAARASLRIEGLTDLAGNVYDGELFVYVYEPPSLVVTIQAPTDPNNPGAAIVGHTKASPIRFQVDFGEAVTEFVQGDMVFEFCTFVSIEPVPGDVDSYFVTVTPNEGDVKITIIGNAVAASAGFLNQETSSSVVTYDTTPPTVAITPVTVGVSSATATNEFAITLRFTITEDNPEPLDVAGFEALLTTTGVDFSGTIRVSDTEFTSTLTIQDKSVSSTNAITIAGLTDLAGNGATISDPFEYLYSPEPLTVGSIGDASDDSGTLLTAPTNASEIYFTVTFSEEVKSDATSEADVFNKDDITCTNCDPSETTVTSVGNAVYKVKVVPMPNTQGDVSITVRANAVSALSTGVENLDSPSSSSISYDGIVPTYEFVESGSDEAHAVATTVYGNDNPITIYVKFSEPLLDGSFVLLDVSGPEGTLGDFQGVSSSIYSFTYLRTSDGSSGISISADAVTDPAGNGNPSSGPVLNIIKDATPPSVGVASTTDGVSSGVETNALEIQLRFTITEDNPKLLDAAEFEDLLTSSGISITEVQKDGEAYLVTLSVEETSKSAPFTASLGINGLTDLAGNVYTSADLFSYVYNPDPLTVTIETQLMIKIKQSTALSMRAQSLFRLSLIRR